MEYDPDSLVIVSCAWSRRADCCAEGLRLHHFAADHRPGTHGFTDGAGRLQVQHTSYSYGMREVPMSVTEPAPTRDMSARDYNLAKGAPEAR